MTDTSRQWITEYHRGFGQTFEITQHLYEAQSPYQHIAIVDTTEFGRMLLLDDVVMTTEHDEFVYHEMISHVPLLAHPHPKNVLVIGGGDGGTIREIVKHSEVESVTLCEIDAMVIDSCKTWLPTLASQFDHPKVTTHIGDGVAYMETHAHNLDVIIIDSTDPIGPGEGLFTETFYQHAYAALNTNGILVAQTESPFLDTDILQRIYPLYNRLFPQVCAYTGHIPSYPGGLWTWCFCSKGPTPNLSTEGKTRAQRIEPSCRYYNAPLHDASFVLPTFVKQQLIPMVTSPC